MGAGGGGDRHGPGKAEQGGAQHGERSPRRQPGTDHGYSRIEGFRGGGVGPGRARRGLRIRVAAVPTPVPARRADNRADPSEIDTAGVTAIDGS
ncbi:hypothetical protein GCM10010169_13570 [Micromonospora fulviviridis]|nr:hypothetical protein GCM10010169_13570 [Micromonospora fulviviridis]